MAVRRQCNRYRTPPFGADFNDVLKRGKAFHKDGEFMVWGGSNGGVWCADSIPAWGEIPADAKIYKKVGHRWIEQN